MSENRFDQAARFAAKIDPPEFLTWVLGLPPERLGFGGWLDTRAIPFPGEPDRTGDLVARLDHRTAGSRSRWPSSSRSSRTRRCSAACSRTWRRCGRR